MQRGVVAAAQQGQVLQRVRAAAHDRDDVVHLEVARRAATRDGAPVPIAREHLLPRARRNLRPHARGHGGLEAPEEVRVTCGALHDVGGNVELATRSVLRRAFAVAALRVRDLVRGLRLAGARVEEAAAQGFHQVGVGDVVSVVVSPVTTGLADATVTGSFVREELACLSPQREYIGRKLERDGSFAQILATGIIGQVTARVTRHQRLHLGRVAILDGGEPGILRLRDGDARQLAHVRVAERAGRQRERRVRQLDERPRDTPSFPRDVRCVAEVPLHVLEERRASKAEVQLQLLGAYEIERLGRIERRPLRVIAAQPPVDLLPLHQLAFERLTAHRAPLDHPLTVHDQLRLSIQHAAF